MHPRVAAPGFVSGLAGSGNGIESPYFLARIHIPGGDKSTHAELAASGTRDDLVFHDKRSMRERVALLWIGGRGVPQFHAGPGIDRNHSRIERRQEQLVAQNCEPTCEFAATITGRRV